jgi:hypothetical protein
MPHGGTIGLMAHIFNNKSFTIAKPQEDFRFRKQGPYTKVDMIPAIGIENRLKELENRQKLILKTFSSGPSHKFLPLGPA